MNLLDSDEAWTPCQLHLYPHSLRAYKDPSNFASQTMKISLRQINEKKGVYVVKDAIEFGGVSGSEWSNF